MEIKDKAQVLFDEKLVYLNKVVELTNEVTDKLMEIDDIIDEKVKNKTLSDEEIEQLYTTRVCNSLMKNKLIELIEFKKTCKNLGIELNLDEYLKLPNVAQFETSYEVFLEDNDFLDLENDKLILNEELKNKTIELFKNEIYTIEVQ